MVKQSIQTKKKNTYSSFQSNKKKQLWLVPLSKSSTTVNGKAIVSKSILKNDDLITIAGRNFRFEDNLHDKKPVAAIDLNSSFYVKPRELNQLSPSPVLNRTRSNPATPADQFVFKAPMPLKKRQNATTNKENSKQIVQEETTTNAPSAKQEQTKPLSENITTTPAQKSQSTPKLLTVEKISSVVEVAPTPLPLDLDSVEEKQQQTTTKQETPQKTVSFAPQQTQQTRARSNSLSKTELNPAPVTRKESKVDAIATPFKKPHSVVSKLAQQHQQETKQQQHHHQHEQHVEVQTPVKSQPQQQAINAKLHTPLSKQIKEKGTHVSKQHEDRSNNRSKLQTPVRSELTQKAQELQHQRHHIQATTQQQKLQTPLRKQLRTKAEQVHADNVAKFEQTKILATPVKKSIKSRGQESSTKFEERAAVVKQLPIDMQTELVRKGHEMVKKRNERKQQRKLGTPVKREIGEKVKRNY